MVIDVFSKYGWAIPIKYKTGEEVRNALESIFKKVTPRKIWSDEGNEFWNVKVKRLFQKHNKPYIPRQMRKNAPSLRDEIVLSRVNFGNTLQPMVLTDI